MGRAGVGSSFVGRAKPWSRRDGSWSVARRLLPGEWLEVSNAQGMAKALEPLGKMLRLRASIAMARCALPVWLKAHPDDRRPTAAI